VSILSRNQRRAMRWYRFRTCPGKERGQRAGAERGREGQRGAERGAERGREGKLEGQGPANIHTPRHVKLRYQCIVQCSASTYSTVLYSTVGSRVHGLGWHLSDGEEVASGLGHLLGVDGRRSRCAARMPRGSRGTRPGSAPARSRGAGTPGPALPVDVELEPQVPGTHSAALDVPAWPAPSPGLSQAPLPPPPLGASATRWGFRGT